LERARQGLAGSKTTRDMRSRWACANLLLSQ
jgi:hypothetical protein